MWEYPQNSLVVLHGFSLFFYPLCSTFYFVLYSIFSRDPFLVSKKNPQKRRPFLHLALRLLRRKARLQLGGSGQWPLSGAPSEECGLLSPSVVNRSVDLFWLLVFPTKKDEEPKKVNLFSVRKGTKSWNLLK